MPTLEVIQEKLKKLQAQADVLIAKKAQSAINQIRRLMLEHGLTTEDIGEETKARREATGDSGLAIGSKRKASKALGTKVAPKFQDPKSGATWTGRGSAPAWIAKAKDRTRFLIQGDAVAATAASPEAEDANATGTAKPRGYRTGPQPAKYRDRKSGATWSGKGRAPAWLANVRDRTKFLIEEGASPVAEVATKAARKASAVAKKANAAKKATRNVAAKKITAKKAAATKNEAKEATPRQSVGASKKVAAKKTGPVGKKRVAKKLSGSGNAAKAATVADDNGSTQAAIEAPVV
ncbi:H-NS family nucleoid-associated regulatory protein [Caballeronia sp. dw_276]|uniref:H-NS family nucleoid-associated regulatory protein n=1 Tax=Caballeronia sp. dw_276 TaxID=2719795 RepID=UPI001BD313F6|nr:H-NS family nucleoid-associated regulatory protein [Caballeronia sp. dw_276]